MKSYKLQKINKYAATLVLLYGTILGSHIVHLRMNKNDELKNESKETVEFVRNEPKQTAEFSRNKKIYEPISNEQLERELSLYGSLSNNKLPIDMYKIIEIKDNDGSYKIVISKINVDYLETDDGIKEKYTIVDAFFKTELFETYDFITFDSINDNFSESELLRYSEIKDLNKILSYDNLEIRLKEFYSDYEMAALYIYNVPEKNRISPLIFTMENPHK